MDLAIAHGVCSTGAHEHHTLRGADLDVCELRAVEVKGIVRQDLSRQKAVLLQWAAFGLQTNAGCLIAVPGHLRIGHVVPVDDVEHSLLRDGVSIPEDATSPTCRGRATRSLEALYTKDRQGSSARGRRRPARPHPCQMPTPDPRCCRECRPQDRKKTQRGGTGTCSKLTAPIRVQKVGQAARETMLKFVGVSLALLESKEGVFPSRRGWATAGDKTSIVSSERSMARLTVFDDILSGVSAAAHALARLSSAADEPEQARVVSELTCAQEISGEQLCLLLLLLPLLLLYATASYHCYHCYHCYYYYYYY